MSSRQILMIGTRIGGSETSLAQGKTIVAISFKQTRTAPMAECSGNARVHREVVAVPKADRRKR